MKASEAPGPIRMLPPVLPDTAPSDRGQPSGPPDRRWVPIAAVAVAIAVLTAIGVFQSPADQAADTEALTTDTVPSMAGEPVPTTVAPNPPLARVLPGLEYNPTVVYRPDGDRTAWASWFSSSSVPETSVTWGADSAVAALDASRRLVMAVTDEGAGTLWVGRVPNVVPAFIDIRGAAWHTTEPGHIAFVGRAPGSERYHLFTATGSAPGGFVDLVDLGPVSDRSELLAWGEWGFTLSQLVDPNLRLWDVPAPLDTSAGAPPTRELLHITLLLDPDGEPWRSIPGVPEAVGPHGELVVQPRIGAYRAAIEAGHTNEELGFFGEVVLVGERDIGQSVAAVAGPDQGATNARFFLDQADLAAGTREFLFTPDGAVVMMLSRQDRGLLATASTLHSNSVVRSTVEADRAIGFSRDGTYLITQDDSNGDIVLLDWRRGSSIRIPFGLGRLLIFDI